VGPPFAKIGEEVVWKGRLSTVRVDSFRHDDGAEVTREVIAHPGAVGVVAIDDTYVWLVRQPREVVGEVTLELPAGKLDVEGEAPLETARRELAEEIGKAAERWESLGWFWSSPGFTNERVELFLAEGLSDAVDAAVDDEERIEVVPWPLDRLDQAIAECHDSKSLVGLLRLALRRRAE
jgi:8-oxo-dGTP pyrophosphatase MutT (NUDIX family)